LAASISSGLDQLIDIIHNDPGLQYHVATSERQEAAASAQRMNEIIIEALGETGVANNGQINAADVRDLNGYIRANYEHEWVVLHGDDEDTEETGFHLVQNDGARTYLFGSYNAINTVADGIYHLGFEIQGDRLLNEDGNRNASVESVAYWLDTLLQEDLASGSLVSTVEAYAQGTTGTGLDSLIGIIADDPGLNYRIPTSEITTAGRAADTMNRLIIESIIATGAANDDQIDSADIYAINAYLQEEYYEKWVVLHGDDESDEETGFHLVQNDGARTYLFGGHNAVNTIADGIYHLGFDIERGRLLNEDGNRNASVDSVAFWLDELLEADLAGDGLDNLSLASDPATLKASEVYTLDELVMDQPEDYVEVLHNENLELSDGTVALRFTADNVTTTQALFSKDAKYYGDGGHLTVRLRNAYIEARIQSTSQSYTLRSQNTSLRAGETYHLAITFGEDGFRMYLDGELARANLDYAGGIEANQEHLAIGANIWARDARNPDWTANYFQGTIEDFAIYDRGLNRAEISYLAGEKTTPDSPLATTDTGLDQLVKTIVNDPGLNRYVTVEDITTAAIAANQMNTYIIDAIVATGVANDGVLNAADIRDVNEYLRTEHLAEWVELHGDDEDDQETGFHLVQNDGARTKLFGSYNAVNTIADGIYHLGFEIESNRLLNEDGNRNASLKSVAFWLSELLQEDLASGDLTNSDIESFPGGTTGTGLDQLVGIIVDDIGLQHNVATSEIVEAAGYADRMNAIILEAIQATGVANNGRLNAADIRDVNAYIRTSYGKEWVMLHGDDEHGEETGFHLVQNDGARTYLYNRNAVNTVADGIYHLGFAIQGDRLLNEDGNRNASLKSVAYWLEDLLQEDLADRSLENSEVVAYATGSTDTGLDQLITIIADDAGLNRKIATSEITAGATAGDEMNKIIVEAIRATGIANDGQVDSLDVYDINAYIQAKYYERWVELHGDDEEHEETGFHLVQNDGANSRLFGDNAVNTVADGIYHLGFDIERGRLLNEDGNRNASVDSVAFWLDGLLEEDLAGDSLDNPDLEPNLDEIAAAAIYELERLDMTAPEDYLEVEHQEAFELENGTVALTFTADETQDRTTLFSKDAKYYGTGGHLTAFVRNGYVEVRLQSTSESKTLRTSKQLIRPGETHHLAVTFGDDGFRVYLDGKLAALNADFTGGIDGNQETLAIGANIWARHSGRPDWNADHFQGAITDFTIYNRALHRAEVAAIGTPDVPVGESHGTTGTGLDQLVDIIVNDPGLNRRVATDEIFTAAGAANSMNQIIVDSIEATGVATDGDISMGDVRDLNRHIQANYLATWTELHGDDGCEEETGFHLVQNDGAITKLFGGHNAVNTVADGLYHMGFDIRCNRFLNEDGNKNASVERVAFWLNELYGDHS
jgi:hypothetical protein